MDCGAFNAKTEGSSAPSKITYRNNMTEEEVARIGELMRFSLSLSLSFSLSRSLSFALCTTSSSGKPFAAERWLKMWRFNPTFSSVLMQNCRI